jgi:xanthine phosphoribosyltransferase
MVEYYSPDMFLADVRILYDQLIDEKFDAILGIARGGLVLATILANNLDIQELYTVQLKSYEGMTQTNINILHEPDWLCFLDKKILVVDDLIDCGKSMIFVKELLNQHNLSNYKVCVLIDKQKNPEIVPDFYVRVIKDWVAFFWEREYFAKYC